METSVRVGKRPSVLASWRVCAAVVVLGFAAAPVQAARDLSRLTLEQLGDLEVVSISKIPQKLSAAADAITVITGDDIIRSGATSLPEALRLVPGLQVSQIDANKWAIGIRGFASRLSRSILVLIDGRSVYTPLFAGVYWEVQDVLPEDIDRIEVIRGPGGAVWGSNAVNGVINIITRSAADTKGGLVSASLGTETRAHLRGRYGAQAGDWSWRVYGKYENQDAAFHDDTPEYDAWHKTQGGFRMDRATDRGDALTLQGDAYTGEFGQAVGISAYSPPFTETSFDDAELSGANLRARWSAARGRTETSVHSYVDWTRRHEANFAEKRTTFDIDWQQKIRDLPMRQELIWGLGFRTSDGSTRRVVPTVLFQPERRRDDLYTAFVQDALSWSNGIGVSLGSKFEHNDYSGFEVQPSARFVWSPPGQRRTLWAAVSRAVRTPTRTDSDLSLTVNLVPGSPVFARVLGTPTFQPERVIAYEAGYRTMPAARISLDVAVFYNDYKHLLSLETGTPFTEDQPQPAHVVVPFFERNGLEGRSYGGELSVRWDPSSWWRLTANYAHLRMHLTPEEGSTDTSQVAAQEDAPRHQALVWSSMNLPGSVTLDTIVRHLSELKAQQVPAYTEAAVQLAWRPTPRLTLVAAGRNLLHDHHAEFGSEAGRVEIERRFTGKATWSW